MIILRRFVGLLLMAAALVGFVFSILALVAIWSVEPNLTANFQNVVTLLNQTMETTSNGLTVTKDALKTSVATIGNLEQTLTTTAETVESADPMLGEVSRLMKDQLPATILATQQSLATAEQSAEVIDNLLKSLSGIPLIGPSIGYQPEVPLSDALGQVADSLDGLPDSFSAMADSMTTTQSKIQTFQADMSVMAASVGEIQSSVAQYEQVVDGYKSSIDQVQTQLESLSAGLPAITRMLVIGLTVFLAWMAIAQLGLFTQGWELLTEGGRRKPEEEPGNGKADDEPQGEAKTVA